MTKAIQKHTSTTPKGRAAARKSETAADAYREYRKVRRLPPVFSKETAEKMENAFAANTYGPKGYGPFRRSLLMALTLPASELIDMIKHDRETAEAFAEVYVGGGEYLPHLKSVVETLTAAHTRIMMGPCTREDMDELLAIMKTKDAKVAKVKS